MTAMLVDREIPSGDGVVGMVSFVDAVPGTCVDLSAPLDLQFSDRVTAEMLLQGSMLC